MPVGSSAVSASQAQVAAASGVQAASQRGVPQADRTVAEAAAGDAEMLDAEAASGVPRNEALLEILGDGDPDEDDW